MKAKTRKPRVITLLDGTVINEGDTVLAKGEGTSWRTCRVVEILQGCGVDKAIVTAPQPFGTVIRTRYQIRPGRTR